MEGGYIILEKAEEEEEEQKEFELKINEMVIGSYQSKDQKSVIKIIKNSVIKTLYESQEKIIKLFDNCSRIISEAKYKVKQRKRLKI